MSLFIKSPKLELFKNNVETSQNTSVSQMWPVYYQFTEIFCVSRWLLTETSVVTIKWAEGALMSPWEGAMECEIPQNHDTGNRDKRHLTGHPQCWNHFWRSLGLVGTKCLPRKPREADSKPSETIGLSCVCLLLCPQSLKEHPANGRCSIDTC